ncbi:MAG: hypothetical protein EOO93_14745 [Pedobacter sp.]|nr:MAG: hypothetical protein EOO93_14745 [Pedobacter sp.]
MKNILKMLPILLLTIMVSCKKDKTQQKEICKNPTSYEDSQGLYYQFTYNVEGKLSELKTDNSSITFAYQNNGNTVVLIDNYSERTFKLGVDGEVIELVSIAKNSGETTKTNYQRIKTTVGYDVTATEQSFRKNENAPYKTVKRLHKLTVTNGNLLALKLIDLDNNNRELGTMNYGYNISKNLSDYPLQNYLDLVDGAPFISKNLAIRNSVRDETTNTQIYSVFSYEYDANDRMLGWAQTSEYIRNSETTNYNVKGKFEYKCN